MKIYLVRHAQSKRNEIRRSNKVEVDAELTELGKEQAKRLGVYFKKVKVDRVFCSTMKRARSTLDEAMPYLGNVKVVYSDEIVEHKMGIYAENGKDDWDSYVGDAIKEGVELIDHRPKRGESLRDCYERAGKFYKKLLLKYSDEKILIVAHGTFGKYLILYALGLDIMEGKYFGLNNASVSEIDVDNKGKVKNYFIDDFHHIINYALERKGKVERKK